MYKLVILIEPQQDWLSFEAKWPQFLAAAEKMPGLRREASSPVDRLLHGHYHVGLIHELYFDSQYAAQQAMSSAQGQAAGEILQSITEGKLTLLFADHLEDDMENIRQQQRPERGSSNGDEA